MVYYHDARGTLQGAMSFDTLIAVDDWIEVRGDTLTMLWHRTTGQIENAARYLLTTTDAVRQATVSLLLTRRTRTATSDRR